jgi:hypothetical protein
MKKFMKALPVQTSITSKLCSNLVKRMDNDITKLFEFSVVLADHAEQTGDIGRLITIVKGMSSRTADRKLYLTWLTAHTPVRYSFKKGTKQIETVTCKDWENNPAWDVETMHANPYWVKEEKTQEAKNLSNLLKTLEGYGADKALESGKVDIELNIAASLLASYMGGATFTKKLKGLVDEATLNFNEQEASLQAETQEAGAGARIVTLNKAA